MDGFFFSFFFLFSGPNSLLPLLASLSLRLIPFLSLATGFFCVFLSAGDYTRGRHCRLQGPCCNDYLRGQHLIVL